MKKIIISLVTGILGIVLVELTISFLVILNILSPDNTILSYIADVNSNNAQNEIIFNRIFETIIFVIFCIISYLNMKRYEKNNKK